MRSGKRPEALGCDEGDGDMAQIFQAGEFATDGERRAAEALRGLPDDWVVISNKTLVTRDARSFEIDFLVLGDHYVFAIDEKSWRGRIHGGDQVWVRPDGSSERSPLGKIDYVANVLAGELRARVAGLRDVRDHFVHGCVLLSGAEEQPRVRDPRATDGIYLLENAVEQLVRFDQRANHQPISEFRRAIKDVLIDLSNRPRFPKRIGDYQIEEILSNRPGSYAAKATHDLAGPRTLTVYRIEGASPEVRAFYMREFEAIRQLQATGLTPELLDPFTWSEEFLVIPSAPPEGRALGSLKPPEGAEDFVAELSLAAMAFDALAQVHQGGVVHRAISPDTVNVVGTVREPRRILFSGFFAARVVGPVSVAAHLDELKITDPYAAPELALSYGLAEPDSDVYSLALVFLERLSGLRPSDLALGDAAPKLRDRLAERWSQLPSWAITATAELFERALAPGRMASGEDPGAQRPSADSCAARLRAVIRLLHASEAQTSGRLLDGRYRVRRPLGEGASGRTYLVEDTEIDDTLPRTFVVKIFHHPEAVREQAGREFAALQHVQSTHLPRTYDCYPPQCDVHLKIEYVPGPTLAEVRGEFPWDEGRWWRFAEGLLAALETLERHDLRHRDLKPSNIILRSGDDQPVLVDFGFVVPANTPAQPAGSIGYLPPEAYTSSLPPESADRYAAAVILHGALTGVGPGEELLEPLPPRRERLREVLLRAASPRADERYLSAAEFRRALEAERRAPEVQQPEERPAGAELVRQINHWVDAVRGLYRDSATGNADNRGLDSDFARDTYVPTALDEQLRPAILRDRPPAVFLSGNPGDGKTAFLERFRQELATLGGTLRESDPSGWEWMLAGHVFRSCYDASESHGGRSADEQLGRRLRGLEGIGRPSEPLTVLVAINDGRLADFFERHDEEFPWLADQLNFGADDGVVGPDRPWVIDLKRRAFVGLDDSDAGTTSVFQRVLSSLVAPESWAICRTCIAQADCPMLANAVALRGESDGGQARRRLERVVALTHLRRDFHPTMRDLRSTLSFLVTANLSCEQVHRAREGTESSDLLGAERRFWQRAFVPPEGADDLLRGLGRLDPGRFARPRLDRFLALQDGVLQEERVVGLFPAADGRAAAEATPTHYQNLHDWVAAAKRRLYFHGQERELDGVSFSPMTLLPYRHAERFLAALRGEVDLGELLVDLARGITRSDGIAADILDRALCVRVEQSDAQQLTVLKRFPIDDFKLRVICPSRATLVEAIPEVLELSYRGDTPLLSIELDLFELLLRFAEGLRPSAPEYRPLLEDLVPFKNSLILASTHELVLLEAERRIHRITQREGKIVRLTGS